MNQDIHPTKLTIMQVAVEVFGQKGFKGATTKEIAQAAHISEGTIFRHFTNKAEILYEIVNHVVPLVGVESLQKAVADSADMDARDALRHILQNRFENIEKVKTFIRIILTEIQYDEKLRDIYVKRVYEPMRQILKNFFLQRIEQGEFKKMAPELFLNMFFSYVLFSIINPELVKNLNQQNLFDQNAADELTDLLLDGIKGGSNE